MSDFEGSPAQLKDKVRSTDRRVGSLDQRARAHHTSTTPPVEGRSGRPDGHRPNPEAGEEHEEVIAEVLFVRFPNPDGEEDECSAARALRHRSAAAERSGQTGGKHCSRRLRVLRKALLKLRKQLASERAPAQRSAPARPDDEDLHLLTWRNSHGTNSRAFDPQLLQTGTPPPFAVPTSGASGKDARQRREEHPRPRTPNLCRGATARPASPPASRLAAQSERGSGPARGGYRAGIGGRKRTPPGTQPKAGDGRDPSACSRACNTVCVPPCRILCRPACRASWWQVAWRKTAVRPSLLSLYLNMTP